MREGDGRLSSFACVGGERRCDGMASKQWDDAIRRPHLPSLPRFPARVHVLCCAVCASSLSMIGNTRIRCYRQEDAGAPRSRSAVSLCRVGEVAGCNRLLPICEARSGKGSGNMVVLTQFGLQGAGPVRTHPSVNLTPARCRPKRKRAILRPGIFLFQVSGPRW